MVGIAPLMRMKADVCVHAAARAADEARASCMVGDVNGAKLK
jgi:hypothetical protein